MSRDWQKDRQYLETVNEWESGIGEEDIDYLCEIATHYHQQYAAEKERGYRAIQERKQFNQVYEMLLKKFKESEAREQKLREALEKIKRLGWSVCFGGGYEYGGEHHAEALSIAGTVLASLYPKEETK